ncbi:MAG TPA: phosphate signaling complex protein PhoU [Bacteroidaceae bacterium]|nr:phosphate signaling complex protein PhoU [Bacteroidaceae bacterium]
MIQFIESELEILRQQLNEMWTIVYNQMDRATESVLTLDRELAAQVVLRERRVNAFELKIDRDVEELIELYSPVGVDLRFALAVLRINNNLERLGDFAENLAKFVSKCKIPAVPADLVESLRIGEMARTVLQMLELANRAFEEESVEYAAQVIEKDNILDEINAAVTSVISTYIIENKDDVAFAIGLNNVMRKLERAGDHITNIAEDIVFIVDAKVLKHTSKEAEK